MEAVRPRAARRLRLNENVGTPKKGEPTAKRELRRLFCVSVERLRHSEGGYPRVHRNPADVPPRGENLVAAFSPERQKNRAAERPGRCPKRWACRGMRLLTAEAISPESSAT